MNRSAIPWPDHTPLHQLNMPKAIACWVFVLLLWAPASAQKISPATANHRVVVKDAVFRSASLERDMHYRVLMPRDYDKGGRFPVLYLLHGLYGDYTNWDTRTGLENYAEDMPMLIVMPDADNSWYTNSSTVTKDKFEDYVVKDLISEVDSKYRTIHDRRGRAVAGLSMGGYGALKFALKYPDLFVFAGSLSGALNAAEDLDRARPEFREKLLEVFGPDSTSTRSLNDVFQLLKAPHSVPHPYFYLACGTADSFLQTNREFVQQLSSRNIAYEYHETPGGHAWDYWDRSLPPLLHAIEIKLTNSHAASN